MVHDIENCFSFFQAKKKVEDIGMVVTEIKSASKILKMDLNSLNKNKDEEMEEGGITGEEKQVSLVSAKLNEKRSFPYGSRWKEALKKVFTQILANSFSSFVRLITISMFQ